MNGTAITVATFLAAGMAHADDGASPAAATPTTTPTPANSTQTAAGAAPNDAKPVAMDKPAPGPESWMLGDWGGWRTRLQQKGIDLQLGYVSEIATNVRGGGEQKWDYTDQWTFGTTLDFDKLFGVHDAKFQVSFTSRDGNNLSKNANLGTLQQVQEVYGRGQTWRLTQFWYDQKYFDQVFDWKIGRLTIGEDFASFDCDFQNLTFCGSAPGNVVGDYIFNWPVSQWGTRAKVRLGSFGYAQIGFYDENPKYATSEDAIAPTFYSHSKGVLIPVELAWLPTFGNGKLPGSYKFGAWGDTARVPDVVDRDGTVTADNPGTDVNHVRGRYGGYINFQQQITHTDTGNPKGGLNLFLNAVFTDNRTATTDRQVAAGFIYTGPLSFRPDDDVALAVGTTHVNDRVANAQGNEGADRQHSEYAFELYYTVRPIAGLQLRPNVQYILDPGGTSHNRDAVVLGLKTAATF
ncbi:MAG TPA: carbohydrate porin [Dongiaceae bacterium]|nr:carbohydrate porin [Dongiaceae bacterium]